MAIPARREIQVHQEPAGITSLAVNLRPNPPTSYDIVFGANLFDTIAREMAELNPKSRFAIITDDTVGDIYALRLGSALSNAGLGWRIFSFPAGEESKSIETCVEIWKDMNRERFDRNTVVLALGGGVVGDMAGLIAAIYLRGVPYVQIPTTLLAQADSSVGGKTAVDLAGLKNLLGSFKQPARVYVDVETLRTLPDSDFRSGLAESIKHGVILDADYFKYLEDNMGKILGRDEHALIRMSQTNCSIKGSVVEIDPEEKGIRQILNYGHTAGHAIEALSLEALGHEALPHGYAVSIGMMVAGRIAVELGYFTSQALEKQQNLLVAAGLPIVTPEPISNSSIVILTLKDKKAREGRAKYVLPVRIGEMHEFGGEYSTFVDKAVVLGALERTR